MAAVAVVVGLASTTAGCGLVGGDSGGEESPVVRGLRVPSELVDGCGDQASTDAGDVAADRVVARCAAGAPEPDPLPAPTTVRLGVRAPTEELAHVLLADALGAYEEENLTVELVEITDPVELFTALADGRLDAVAAELDAPFFDRAHEGSGARLVLGGAVARAAGDLSVAQPGLWIRNGSVSGPERWRDLRGQRVVVEDGIADAAVYPMSALLRQDDVTIDDLHLVREDGATAADALLAGSVAAAWLPEPFWRDVDGREGVRLVTTLPSEPLTGVVLADRLVDADRDRAVGLAFTRAVIRTVNTHLAGDYQSDDEVVAALADVTGQGEDAIRATPAWVFDWELRRGTSHRLQRPLIEIGGVLYEEELPEGRLVDRSLYRDVVRPQDQG